MVKLPVFERRVQGEGEHRRDEQVPELAPLQGPRDRREIIGQQEQRGETVLRFILAPGPVDVSYAPDQRDPTQVVDERNSPVSVGPHHLPSVGSINVPLPETDVEAGGVQDEIQADTYQGRKGRNGYPLRVLATVKPLRNPPGDDEGAVDDGVPAEEDGQRHARYAVTHAVA